MEPTLTQKTGGVEISVRASPGSRKNELRGTLDGAIKVSVTAVAEKGKANKAIVKLLSGKLGVSKSSIELVSGELSRTKKFLIKNIDFEVLRLALRSI